MHEDADSLTQNNKSYPMFVQNFKIRSAVVPEKFLAEKKFTHIYTHRLTFLWKSQKLYTPPIYLVCCGVYKKYCISILKKNLKKSSAGLSLKVPILDLYLMTTFSSNF